MEVSGSLSPDAQGTRQRGIVATAPKSHVRTCARQYAGECDRGGRITDCSDSEALIAWFRRSSRTPRLPGDDVSVLAEEFELALKVVAGPPGARAIHPTPFVVTIRVRLAPAFGGMLPNLPTSDPSPG